MFILDWTLILLIPGLILGLYAQSKVHSTYKKYSKVYTKNNITGAMVARSILDDNGLEHISLEQVAGNLTDHYDPRNNVIRLSKDVYQGTSVASLGVAAHEVGHAIQDAEGYIPLHFRNAIIPVTQFGSYLYLPLLFLGIFMSSVKLIELGILCFAVIVIFQVVTLPVEFNASKRAIATLGDEGYLTGDELIGTKKVLGAAALTYVAAMITAVLSLLRLLLIFGGHND